MKYTLYFIFLLNVCKIYVEILRYIINRSNNKFIFYNTQYNNINKRTNNIVVEIKYISNINLTIKNKINLNNYKW